MNKPRAKPSAPRPTIEMSRTFVTQVIEAAISENQAIRLAVAGLYEGRQLKGSYRLEITGARLVPEADPQQAPRPDPTPANGTLS